jgi:SprT-like family
VSPPPTPKRGRPPLGKKAVTKAQKTRTSKRRDERAIVAATPTEEAYPELQAAYDWFNHKLFENRLPPWLITLAIKGRSLGYFWPNRFVNTDGVITAELALNPERMKLRSDRDTLSTLVHEQAHGGQHTYGKPSRNGYHNKEWASMMESIGLMPSHTGQPGGKRTGQSMSHYIIDGGPFDRACAELLKPGSSSVGSRRRPPRKKSSVRSMCARAVASNCGARLVVTLPARTAAWIWTRWNCNAQNSSAVTEVTGLCL